MDLFVVLMHAGCVESEPVPPETMICADRCGWTLILGCPDDDLEVPLPRLERLYPAFVREMCDRHAADEERAMQAAVMPAVIRQIDPSLDEDDLYDPALARTAPFPARDARLWAAAWLETIRSAPADRWRRFVQEIIWQGYDPKPYELMVYGTPEEWAAWLAAEFESIRRFAEAAECSGTPLVAEMGGG